MKRPPFYILAGLAVVLAAAYYFYSHSIPAFWTLNAAESSLSFTSVKNGNIEEVHTITGLSGGADFMGEYLITMDLRTVETNFDIRNERMREFFFETDTWALATISGPFEPRVFENLPVGATLRTRISGTLSLHGIEQPIAVDVVVTRTAWDRVTVSSFLPVIIDAADYSLEGGIETLRGLVGLDSISPITNVSFELVLEGGVTPGY